MAVWADIEHVPGYSAVVDGLEDEEMDAGPIRQAFALGNRDLILDILSKGGYAVLRAETEERYAAFPSVEIFIAMLTSGSGASRNALGKLEGPRRASFVSRVTARLNRFTRSDGLHLRYRANVINARTPA